MKTQLCKSFSLVFVGFSILFAVSSRSDDSKDWDSILPKGKMSCVKSNPCWIKIDKTDDNFELVFETELDSKSNLRSLKTIRVKNISTGHVQNFRLKEVARVEPDEMFKVYRSDLRQQGYQDFAVYSFNSPRHGELFYYFIYDPKIRGFVMSEEEIPKIKKSQNGKDFVAFDDSSLVFEIDSHFKLKRKKTE